MKYALAAIGIFALVMLLYAGATKPRQRYERPMYQAFYDCSIGCWEITRNGKTVGPPLNDEQYARDFAHLMNKAHLERTGEPSNESDMGS